MESFVYLDDIVIYSQNIQEHIEHIKQLFDMLEAAGLTLNLSKCNLLQRSITFLGHVVSAEGVCTETAKVEAVQNFPVPTMLKEVQPFLGLAGWYHRFIPHFSEIAAPWHALKSRNVVWE